MIRLAPLTCQLGDHSGNFSIYKMEAGWGCAPCITKALGRVPAFLKASEPPTIKPRERV